VLRINIYKKCMKIHLIKFLINKLVCFFSFYFFKQNQNNKKTIKSFAFLLLLSDIVCSIITILTDDITKQSYYCCLLLSSLFVFDYSQCVNLFSLVSKRMSSPFTNISFLFSFFNHPCYLGTWKDHLE